MPRRTSPDKADLERLRAQEARTFGSLLNTQDRLASGLAATARLAALEAAAQRKRAMQQAAVWSERRRASAADSRGEQGRQQLQHHTQRQRAHNPLRAGGGIIRGAVAAPQPQPTWASSDAPTPRSHWIHTTPSTRVPSCDATRSSTYAVLLPTAKTEEWAGGASPFQRYASAAPTLTTSYCAPVPWPGSGGNNPYTGPDGESSGFGDGAGGEHRGGAGSGHRDECGPNGDVPPPVPATEGRVSSPPVFGTSPSSREPESATAGRLSSVHLELQQLGAALRGFATGGATSSPPTTDNSRTHNDDDDDHQQPCASPTQQNRQQHRSRNQQWTPTQRGAADPRANGDSPFSPPSSPHNGVDGPPAWESPPSPGVVWGGGSAASSYGTFDRHMSPSAPRAPSAADTRVDSELRGRGAVAAAAAAADSALAAVNAARAKAAAVAAAAYAGHYTAGGATATGAIASGGVATGGGVPRGGVGSGWGGEGGAGVAAACDEATAVAAESVRSNSVSHTHARTHAHIHMWIEIQVQISI